MMDIVAKVEKEHATEAQQGKYEADLKEVIAELNADVDPTAEITMDAIKKTTSLDELEDWSRLVHEYNGDNRILAIYDRAADLTKNEEHKAMLKQLRAWSAKTFTKKNAAV